MKSLIQSVPMKPLIKSTVLLFFISAGLNAAAPPASANTDIRVNAYGEPAGFGNVSDAVIPNTPELNVSHSRPGTGGMYVVPGTVDRRNFDSMGMQQARFAATQSGKVTIGALEVLDSGPTGVMTDAARTAARTQVTNQVLNRIRVTDKIMASLTTQSESRDRDTQAGFNAAARDVAASRQALREDLKAVRAADDAQWSTARTAVAVSYNAYVQTLHRAEEISFAAPKPATS